MGRRRVSDEHKRAMKRADNKRREKTRIHLGNCFEQWSALRALRKDNNVQFADHLLKVHDHYCRSCRELRSGTMTRVEYLHSDYDTRQDEVSSRESQSTRSIKVVNQDGQVYVTLSGDKLKKTETGITPQHQQQIPVLVGSQQSLTSHQQNVLVHSPFVINKPQITNSNPNIGNEQPGCLNQMISGYVEGKVPSVQSAQGVTLNKDNPSGQNNPGKDGVRGTSSSGKQQVLVEKQLEVKEEPVDDFVVVINPDDDDDDDDDVDDDEDDGDDEDEDEDEDEDDGETTESCDESDLTHSEYQQGLVEIKEEPVDDVPDHAGHLQVNCSVPQGHRGFNTAGTSTNGTQDQLWNSRVCLQDGNPFRSPNTTSPGLRVTTAKVITCYRYGDLVRSQMASSSNHTKANHTKANHTKAKLLVACNALLKQMPQTGRKDTLRTETGQGQTDTRDQENLRKRRHVPEEQEETLEKQKKFTKQDSFNTIRTHKPE
ncbi:eisosome protein SEG2-like isoform X2 [Haliotis rufescens]|uniref:eisosome protein SEG2-like isoform X2 n=1 Tax=Haliotis rufescens TaxID=6454 RepID=UPI00201EC03C|nr:eisosome protein SEG2-like isoform X2 [Haliotis rufescens]